MVEAHIFRINKSEMEFLLLKRAEKEVYPGLWQMVSGKVKNNEKAYNAALREINEETGIVPSKLWIVPNINSFYSHIKDEINLIPVFAALVDENSSIKISDEHSEYIWVSKDKTLELLAWKGQKDSVNIIYDYFMNHSSLLKFIQIDF